MEASCYLNLNWHKVPLFASLDYDEAAECT